MYYDTKKTIHCHNLMATSDSQHKIDKLPNSLMICVTMAVPRELLIRSAQRHLNLLPGLDKALAVTLGVLVRALRETISQLIDGSLQSRSTLGRCISIDHGVAVIPTAT